MTTCKDAKELQRRIDKNLDAILKTAPALHEAMDDLDTNFAIEQAENLASQVGGLLAMLKEAKSRKINILDLEA